MTKPPLTSSPLTRLGATGPEVFPIALGCMGMSGMYGPTDEHESLATIHMALERGVTLLDTGDFYGQGDNEALVGRALREGSVARDRVLLSVKFGALRAPDGSFTGYDGRPNSVKNFLAYSLRRLRVDYVDIYRPSRLDPSVPIEDTIGAISEMVQAGYVRHIGLSEVGAETIRRAHAVHPIVDLQIEYSLLSRSPEAHIWPVVEELGIAVTAYGVLSRGLLTGAQPSPGGDFRSHLPRFSADNRARNQRLVDALHTLAGRKGVSPAQLCIAWVRSKGPTIVPLMGSRTRRQLEDALGGVHVTLAQDEVAALEQALPAGEVAGARYPEFLMSMLDSER